MRTRLLSLLTVFLLCACPAVSSGDETVPLTLHFTDLKSDEEVPVTFGLPMPKGLLKDVSNLSLKSPEGFARPFAARVQAKWRDGSARWLLLDFQASPSKDRKLNLVIGDSAASVPAPALPVKVKEGEDEVSVDTGALRFSVPKNRFGLRDVHVRSAAEWKGVPITGKVTVAEGHKGEWIEGEVEGVEFAFLHQYYREYSTSVPPDSYRVEVEESSPLQAVIKCTGLHGSRTPKRVEKKALFDFVIRIHAYAGKPYVRVFYTLVNDQVDEEFFVMRALEMRVPLGGKFTGWETGAMPGLAGAWSEEEKSMRVVQVGPTRWRQDRDFGTTVRHGRNVSRKEGRAPGWVAVSNGEVRVLAALRRFAEQHPKSVEASPEALRIGLWPDHHEPLPFASGMAKTHEILLCFSAGKGAPPPAWFEDRPIFSAPPKWFAKSRPWGAMSVSDEKRHARFEKQNRMAYEGMLYSREQNKSYGFLDFGDTAYLAFHWMNLEYDQPHAMFMMFARSGDPKCFRLGEEMARHMYDADVLHRNKDPKFTGMAVKHGEGHTGHRDGHGERHHEFGHVWLEGPLDLYLLTGDRRGLTTARGVADHLALTMEGKHYDPLGHPQRNVGWPLVALSSFYRVVPEKRYAAAADALVDCAVRWQNGEGGWLQGDEYAKTFMVGVLMHGLARWHEEGGSEKIPALMAKGADWLFKNSWRDGKSGFVYSTRPGEQTVSPGSLRYLPGFAYAYRLTKDKRFLRVILKGLDAGLDPENQVEYIERYSHGKGFLTVNLSCEEALALVTELGVWKDDKPDWEAFEKLK